MFTLKKLAAEAPPLKKIDYRMASKVAQQNQRDSDVGLVTLAVDSSNIGAGWIISQVYEDGDFLVLFSSVTFNEPQNKYSQPKLELYGLFHAIKAKRHLLYGIHF